MSRRSYHCTLVIYLLIIFYHYLREHNQRFQKWRSPLFLLNWVLVLPKTFFSSSTVTTTKQTNKQSKCFKIDSDDLFSGVLLS